jgi:hypothetical protein
MTATLPDLNTLTLDALKALIVAQHERLLTREREVEHFKLLRRQSMPSNNIDSCAPERTWDPHLSV